MRSRESRGPTGERQTTCQKLSRREKMRHKQHIMCILSIENRVTLNDADAPMTTALLGSDWLFLQLLGRSLCTLSVATA